VTKKRQWSKNFRKFTDPQMVVSSPEFLLADVQKLIFVDIAILDKPGEKRSVGPAQDFTRKPPDEKAQQKAFGCVQVTQPLYWQKMHASRRCPNERQNRGRQTRS
jgi:hypothetical protein